ncbi:MAG: hypothetical protein ACOCP7_02275 [Desulfohalobiaceae bacterium]
MSNSEQKQIVQEIYSLLCRDLELEQKTLHSLHSLWGIESPQQLKDFLQKAGDGDIQTLIELILFPDQDCKLRIHSCLQQGKLAAAEQANILNELMRQAPQARISFPGYSEQVQLELDSEIVIWFLERLQLHKPLDPDLQTAIQDSLPQKEALRISLEIKSKPQMPQGPGKELLLKFLSQANMKDQNLWPCLRQILDLTQEMDPRDNIWSFLVRKKLQLEHSLRLAHRLNQQLGSLPMEALLMQRVSILCINQDQVREQIHYLDQICFSIFGSAPGTDLPLSQTEYPDPSGD